MQSKLLMREADIVRIKQRFDNIVVAEDQKGISKLSRDEIHDLQMFHESKFAVVYKGHCRSKMVAVKMVKKELNEDEIKKFLFSCSSIFHPNLLLIMGSSISEDNHVMLITELVNYNLTTFLKAIEKEKKPFSLLKQTQMAKEIALGINWLHNSNPKIIHGGMNPNNILIDSDYRVKISDFGLYELKDGLEAEPIENLRWISPEVLDGQPRTEKCDIFGFGLILWVLITGQDCPYAAYRTLEELQHHHKQQLPIYSYVGCSKSFQELIEDCVNPEVAHRPIFKSITLRLELIIIDTILEDQAANIFWKKHFLEDMCVQWADFIKAFSKEYRIELPMNQNTPPSKSPAQSAKKTPTQREPPKPLFSPTITLTKEELELQKTILCFKSILVNENNQVDLEWFGKIIQWFGTLDSLGSLKKIEELVTSAYFFGNIDAAESESFLRTKPVGTFLVRFSLQFAGAFTLSKTTNLKTSNKNGIVHQRFYFHQTQQKYYINVESNTFYDSIGDLISKERENLQLTTACEGSPFSAVASGQQTILGYVEH